MIKIKFVFNLIILALFFFGSVYIGHSQVFPYKIIKEIKNKTYDKFFAVKENPLNLKLQILLEKDQQKYPDFKNKKRNVIKYSNEKNIWADRIYYNQKNDAELLNFYLIRIKRHQTQDIKIEIKEDSIIYRPICEKNNNLNYNDWEKVDFEIAIIGDTCAHKKIVKKKFKKGYINLSPGGPTASDPIFIEGLSSKESIIFN